MDALLKQIDKANSWESVTQWVTFVRERHSDRVGFEDIEKTFRSRYCIYVSVSSFETCVCSLGPGSSSLALHKVWLSIQM